MGFLSLVEITALTLERILQLMRAVKFITGHMAFNPDYNQILQLKATFVFYLSKRAKNYYDSPIET